jgi:hypothetical protein
MILQPAKDNAKMDAMMVCKWCKRKEAVASHGEVAAHTDAVYICGSQ